MRDIFSFSGKLYKLLCVLMLAAMVVIVFTNTMLRYLFASGIAQSEEILRYLFVWLTFLGATAAYKNHEHIAVTVLTNRLSPRVAAGLAILVNLAAALAFAFLAYGSVGYFAESGTTIGQLTGIPYRAIITASIVMASLCCLFALRDTIASARRLVRPVQGE